MKLRIGEAIRHFRVKKGLNQTELGELLYQDNSRSYQPEISKFEKNRPVDNDEIQRLEVIFELERFWESPEVHPNNDINCISEKEEMLDFYFDIVVKAYQKKDMDTLRFVIDKFREELDMIMDKIVKKNKEKQGDKNERRGHGTNSKIANSNH